jgi:NADPH:quinone reductase-like Zn-dependent oxidoreductase
MEGDDDMTAMAVGPETMRAAVRERYGAPREIIEFKQVPKPTLEDDQVLVRVRATSLNRSDYYTATAPILLFRKMVGGSFRRPKTFALGGDFAGVVEAVGKDVTDFEPGDEVFGARTGAFSEYVAARMIAKKPANVSFEEAATFGGSALTALQALRDKGKLQPGQSVLSNGASGAIGPFAVQMAKALGAGKVTAVCSTRNVEQTRELGVDRVIDYTQDDWTKSGERYDLIVDVAATKPWRRIIRALKPDGTYVLVGSPITNPITGPLGKIGRLVVASRFTRRKFVFFIASFNKPDMEVLRELLASGKVKPVIERVYPFAQLVDALEYMGEGHARAKLVVTVE